MDQMPNLSESQKAFQFTSNIADCTDHPNSRAIENFINAYSVGPALLTSANAKKNQDDRFGDKVRDKAIDTIIKNVAGQAGRIFLRGKSWIDNGLTAYATYLDYMRLTACELYAGFKARAMSITPP